MNERDRIAEFLGRLDYESSNDHPLCAPCLRERILRRSCFSLVFTLVLGLFIPGASASITKWDPLPTPVGNANFRGYAQIERNLGSWSLPDGTEIPLYLVFQSDPSIEPGSLGAGWHFPFFRSDFLRVKDYEAVWEMPNGRRMFFPRDRLSEDSRDDEQLFRSRDGEWMAVWEKNRDEIEATVTSTEDPDWWFHYEEGRLHSFQMGAESSEYEVDWFGGSNYPRAVRPENRRDGPVEIIYGGRTPESIRVADRTWIVEMNEGDWTAPDGRSDYADYRVRFLVELANPEGLTERFLYEKGELKERAVGVADQPGVTRTVRLPVNRLALQDDSGVARGFLAWEARSGFLVEDSGGEYTIVARGADPEEPGFEESQRKGNIAPDEVRIERQPEEGPKELWSYNYRTGVRERADSSMGKVFRETFIVSAGPAYGKLRKKESKRPGGRWELMEQLAYDAQGRLLREIYSDSSVRQVWTEAEGGVVVERFRDGVLMRRDRRVNGRLAEREIISDSGSIERYIFGRKDGRSTITRWLNDELVSYREMDADGRLAYMRWPDGKEQFWDQSEGVSRIITVSADGRRRMTEYRSEHGWRLLNDEQRISQAMKVLQDRLNLKTK